MKKGIDISVHNGIVNIQKVLEDGYESVFIRAGYGDNNVDQQFLNNADACARLLVPVGFYWFSYGYNEDMAAAEGRFAVAAVKKYWVRCPIAFDLEYDTVAYARKKGVNIDKDLATGMAVAFLREVISAGYIPVLYTNKDYKDNYFDIDRIRQSFQEKIYIWYARYTKSLTAEEQGWVDVWQKSSSGKVAGISGAVDLNEIYTAFDDKATVAAAPTKPAVNINVVDFQKAANLDGYVDHEGEKLVEDGLVGVRTTEVMQKVLLKAKRLLAVFMTGSNGELVKWWQRRLCEMGFATDVDGKFGGKTRKQTMAFQKQYNLTVDGIVGANSIGGMIHN